MDWREAGQSVIMNSMLTSVDARRRWFGAFFLIVAGGMLLWGFTFLGTTLVENPILFVVYWLTCFGLTLLSLGIAIYDMRVIRRRLRDEKRSAFNKAFSDIVDEERK
jgi:uncharacterized membrane protein YhaH (DUF805 family)